MTTGRIDVLAFLKALDGNTCSLELNAKAFHAHAAVAELIEAAARLVKLANEASTEGRFADGMGEELTALEDTQAALARVGGA